MNRPQKFDPPETVVSPALSELMNRLARSRAHAASEMEMSDEERKIFEYGVQERKRVLENTLFLVFGQWALYRQGVSRLKSRALRVAYGVGAFLSTAYFVGARAKRVTHEMFATIATTATTSPLGNEARVVLAELEGPDGPYFRNICREKGFEEDISTVIAALDAREGVDPTADNLHPQLRLRPRLIVRGVHHPKIEPGFRQGDERRKRGGRREELERERRIAGAFEGRSEKEVGLRMDGMSRVEQEQEQRWTQEREQAWAQERRRTLEREQEWERYSGWRDNGDTAAVKRGRIREGHEMTGWGNWGEGGAGDRTEEDSSGKPFDFAEAAKKGWETEEQEQVKQEGALDDRLKEESQFEKEEKTKREMTPSQRRAAERRMKRTRARTRAERGGEDSIDDGHQF